MPDREKVIKGLEHAVDVFDGRIFGPMYDMWMDATKDALALLKAQEPRTETQGRWERVGSDGIVCCSVCGVPMNKTRVCWPDGGSGYYYLATNYCPHCGARNEKGDCDG